MLRALIPYLIAALVGAAIGGEVMHLIGKSQLAAEQVAHARDNERHASDLNDMSKAALDAESRALDAHARAASDVAAIDAELTKERETHEADNAKNRDAIADGARRLRIAVADFHPTGSDEASSGASTRRVGDGASGTAELPSAFGVALFGIADDADGDARAKADYLQRYVCALQRQGMIEGGCGLAEWSLKASPQ